MLFDLDRSHSKGKKLRISIALDVFELKAYCTTIRRTEQEWKRLLLV